MFLCKIAGKLLKLIKLSIIYDVSKNCAFLFLSELRQISTDINKFWWVDGKVAEIVCFINIFYLT